MEILELHKLFLIQKEISIDSRTIKKNAIFFALKGLHFDGNYFSQDALKNGASYTIIDDENFYTDAHTILVENTLETIQKLALFHRKYLNIPILAVTGSNGKTTTKELIKNILSTQFKVSATMGNLNNHIGVPLTILKMTRKTQIGVVEMGANHLKEIENLCRITMPNFGYISNFGKAHLEGFGSQENVIKGKCELYDYISSRKGIAFVDKNDPLQLEKSSHCQRILIESKNKKLMKSFPFLEILYNKMTIKMNIIGEYNYANIKAAIDISTYFNITDDNIKRSLEIYTSKNNRSQIVKKKTNTLILDAYNANPSSMIAALENLNQFEEGKDAKGVILGDMFELGKNNAYEHRDIIKKVLHFNFNISIFIGKNFFEQRMEELEMIKKTENTMFFDSFEDFKKEFTFDFKNTILLIKGSRSMKLERILDLF